MAYFPNKLPNSKPTQFKGTIGRVVNNTGKKILKLPFQPVKPNPDILNRKKTVSLKKPNQENRIIRDNIEKKENKLKNFVRSHPWLAGGFVLSAALLALSLFLTVEALLGHTTISIFKAHPEIGGAMVFMCLNYSITLFNICRRVYAKEELEIKREGLKKEMEKSLSQEKSEAAIKRSELEEVYKKENAAFEKKKEEKSITLETLMQQLETLKLQKEIHKGKIDDNFANNTIQLAEEISQGFDQLDFSLPKELNLTEIPPEVEEKRKETQNSFILKIQKAAQGLKGMFKESPGSVALLGIGIGMCILSGIACGYMLHGSSQIYFFGSLTLMSVAPGMMYGLSTIYEAFNSAQITSLNLAWETIESEYKRRRMSFRQSLQLDEDKYRKERENLIKKSEEVDQQIEEIKNTNLLLAKNNLELIKQISAIGVEVGSTLEDVQKGAELITTN